MIRSTEIIEQVADLAMCTVSPSTTLKGVIESMVANKRALALVVEGGSILGVVSEGDIVRAIHDEADVGVVWAADIMTADPVVIDPNTAAWDVLEMMLDEHIRHVIVSREDGPSVVGFFDVVDLVLPR
jgi:CBS domain-containing protein